MYYSNNEELPENVKHELPHDAQDLYRRTFNRNYPDISEQVRVDSLETANKAAWRAVREKYHLVDSNWVKR